MTNSTFQNETVDKALSLNDLKDINGAGLKNEYAKLLKPKPQKKIKIVKHDSLKYIISAGSPGPYLPGPSYINQQAYNSYNYWM